MTTPERIDDQVEAAAQIATTMALALAPEARDKLVVLRSSGWRAAVEFSFDANGLCMVYLTAVSAKGERRKFGQVMQTAAH